jgi:hypothetical protein
MYINIYVKNKSKRKKPNYIKFRESQNLLETVRFKETNQEKEKLNPKISDMREKVNLGL